MLREQFLNSVKIVSIDVEEFWKALFERVRILKAENREVREVFLFGSFARGDYTPESDVDILIVCSQLKTPFLLRPEKFAGYFRAFPFDVNLLVYTEAELNRMKEEKNPFILNVLSEAKEI